MKICFLYSAILFVSKSNNFIHDKQNASLLTLSDPLTIGSIKAIKRPGIHMWEKHSGTNTLTKTVSDRVKGSLGLLELPSVPTLI